MNEPKLELYPDHKSNAEALAGQPAFFRALADILSRGHTLTRQDVADIGVHYGYNKYSAGPILSWMGGSTAMKAAGIDLERNSYRGRTVYRDGRIPVEHTDMEQTQVHIDELKNQLSAKRGHPGRPTKRDSMLF